MAVGERLSEQPRSGRTQRELPVPRLLTPQQLVLAAQRTHGNRVVARTVKRYLARDPLTKDPPQTKVEGPQTSWAAQTTYANQALAKEIDALENLDDKALRELRDQLALKASIRGDDKHGQ